MNPCEQPENSPRTDAEAQTLQVIKSGVGNVDKIRDILFGSQMRDYETRFARLEETVIKETTEIRESSRRRFDQLEQYIKREFEALEERFKAEREVRSDSGLDSRELRNLAEQMQKRLDEISTSVEELRRDKTDRPALEL
jgi:hypothetical protein